MKTTIRFVTTVVCLALLLHAKGIADFTDFFANVGVPSGRPIETKRIAQDGDPAGRATLRPSNCVPYDPNTPLAFRYRFTDVVTFSGFGFKSIVDDVKSAAEHGRVQTLIVTTAGGTARVDLRDTLALSPIGSERRGQVGRPIPTSALLLSPVKTRTLLIAVHSVYAGTKFKDVCFSGFEAYEGKLAPYRGPPKDFE